MLILASLAAAALTLGAAQNDLSYGEKIRQFTTESFFLTPLVDHLPSAPGIPTPQAAFGHIIGAPNVLDYAADIHKYFRALEKASPRIRIVSMGKSEEGREMIVAIISDEANLQRLDQIREMNATLGDPRRITSPAQADDLIQKTVPMYWVTGGMHAPETGPPEMLAELAYRLVASEEPTIQDIRKNEIVMLTPVLDVDGRERVVDLYRYRKANPTKAPIPLVYWGHYVAHDDNRDALTYRLALSAGSMRTWLDYHPTVLHDLHESVPYLYISTGTGPYNPWLDPIVISEWQEMAYDEIQQMTGFGVPGVWTHNYYDGWAASYGFFIAQGHNGIGRFYETFSAGGADTGIRSVGSEAGRDWYRPNPPFPRVRWSIRDNVNLSESALLMGMHKVAVEKDKFLRNYYLKSKRSVEKAHTEGPVAYVLPASAPQAGFRLRDLLGVLGRQGVEVKRLTFDEKTKDGTFPKGSLVIRMDQPYSRMADMMFDQGYYKPSDPVTYDDTGWQLGPLYNLPVVRVADPAILEAPMTELRPGTEAALTTTSKAYAIPPSADPEFGQLAFGEEGKILEKDTKATKADGTAVSLPAGTLIQSKPSSISSMPIGGIPAGPSHSSRPRIALVHTWQSTQDEGWARIALDSLHLPYKYVSVHELRDKPALRSNYEVIVFPEPSNGSGQALVSGLPMLGDPIPWKATKDYPNIGVLDASDDIRGGIELEGIVHLKDFVKAGGLLICVGNACRLPIDFGLTPDVRITPTPTLNAPGGVFRVERADKTSPVLGGYGDELGVYFNAYSLPVLSVVGAPTGGRRGQGGAGARASGRGSQTDSDIIQGRPPYTPKPLPGDVPERGTYVRPTPPRSRILLRFAVAERLIMSGLLDHGIELGGKPALIDSPLGAGHILLFSFNPFYRGETVGSYELVLNAALNYPNLGSAVEPPPAAAAGGDGD